MSQQQPQQGKRQNNNNGRPRTAPSKPYGNGNNNNSNNQGGFTKQGGNKGFNKQKGGNRQGGNKKPQGPNKTLFINKVFFDDLAENQSETMARHLKEQRIRIVRDTLSKFGALEHFEQSDADNAIYATFEKKEAAIDAIENLKKEDKCKALLDNIRDGLDKQKLPAALCPNFLKYRYGLTQRASAGNAKNSFKQQGSQQQVKNVIATPKDQQPQPAAQPAPTPAPAAQAPAQEPADKKKKEKKPKTAPAQAQPAAPAPAPVQTEQQRRQATEDLMREAEIAKLKNELQFYTKQQGIVNQELVSEKERVKDRDQRIHSLTQELERVNAEKLRIETQLNAEQSWKKKGQESITKLEDEFQHLQEQSQHVDHRLKALASGSAH